MSIAACILVGSFLVWILGSDQLWAPHREESPVEKRTQPLASLTEPEAPKSQSTSSASDSQSLQRAEIKMRAVMEEIANLSPVDLTGLTTNADKIARILASFETNSGVYSEDPRLHQLKALGDSAVNDLLDALDWVKDNRDETPAGPTKEIALRLVLERMLQEKDRDIILSYYREDRSFADLIWKFRFKEAGAFALDLASQEFHGGPHDGTTAEMAVALLPELSIPFMLANPRQKFEIFDGNFLQAIAKHAPHVDLRPALKQVIASINPSSPDSPATTWAALALVRGMPEGFDAATAVLRHGGTESDKKTMLEVVRNFISFNGSADKTAAWLERNRPLLLPKPRLPYGTVAPPETNHEGWIDPREVRLVSPYSPDKMSFEAGMKLPGSAIKDPNSGKMFLVP